MRSTQFNHLAQKLLTFCLLGILWTSSSMAVLAGSTTPVGELIVVDGNIANGPAVTVGSQAAVSGRTIFSSDMITTPAEFGALLNLGKAGRLQLDPKTTISISLEDDRIVGDLNAGKVTVLNAANPFVMRTLAGQLELNAGESAGASSTAVARDDDQRDATGKCIDTDNDGKLECDWAGMPAWGWYALVGVVAAVVVVAVVASSSDDDAVVSPVR